MDSGTVTQWVEQSFNPASSTDLIPTEATHSKMYKKCMQRSVDKMLCLIYSYFSWASQSHPHIYKQ